MAKKETPKMYTKQEAAELLGVSERTIRRYMYTRDLKYQRFGYFVLISEEDLKDFLVRSAGTRRIKAVRKK